MTVENIAVAVINALLHEPLPFLCAGMIADAWHTLVQLGGGDGGVEFYTPTSPCVRSLLCRAAAAGTCRERSFSLYCV